jgi:hypothetical protein
MNEAHASYLLTCGKENAVPATKSVVEQDPHNQRSNLAQKL